MIVILNYFSSYPGVLGIVSSVFAKLIKVSSVLFLNSGVGISSSSISEVKLTCFESFGIDNLKFTEDS